MNQVKLNYAMEQAELAQATNEEGTYEYVSGWHVVGTAAVQHPEDPARVGTGYYVHHKLFRLQDDAKALAAKIQAAGLLINPEHWELVSVDYRTLDDIEADWDALAERERLGLPF